MSSSAETNQFDWQVEAAAAEMIRQLVQSMVNALPIAKTLGERMLTETGTRLVDWVDHLSVADDPQLTTQLREVGFNVIGDDETRWQHPGGIFPTVQISQSDTRRLAIRVDSVVDFLAAHHIHAVIEGRPHSQRRTARISRTGNDEFWVVERHGWQSSLPRQVSDRQIADELRHTEAFTIRKRNFAATIDGFRHAGELIDRAIDDLGVDWACDLFFAAERRYWQSRNRAARVQKARQDQLGLGWANHDHHTYRSSRQHFKQLIELLERLGFVCRERFYGGADAGWGAQVLEQSVAGIVIFADVDLTPQEVMGDFAHEGLPSRDELGTVGLWCELHGEAMLQAGMHHLECQFDFDAARQQLAELAIETMPPFTDMPQLKQAFTVGEIWPVDASRIDEARKNDRITSEQAAKFSSQGSIGSHLEILERNGGYKGFNQTGISEIIRQTDPRQSQ